MNSGEAGYISMCLTKPELSLWFELGTALIEQGYSPMRDTFGARREKPKAETVARQWFLEREDAIRRLVCVQFDYCAKKREFKVDKLVPLVSALTTTLATVFAGPVGTHTSAATVLAVLLLRHGLDTFCGCESAEAYVDRSLEPGTPYERQISLLKTALKENPLSTTGHYHLGLAYDEEGEVTRAIDSYKNAIELNPDHYYALNNLGYLLLSRNDREPADAFPYVERAFQAAPDSDVVNHTYGLGLLRMGRPAEAIAPLLQALQTRKTPERIFHLAQAYAKSGQTGKGLDLCASMKTAGMLGRYEETVSEFLSSGGQSQLV